MMHEFHTVKSQRNVFTLKTNIATGLDSISDLFRHGYLELLEHLLLCRWLTYIYVDWEKLKFNGDWKVARLNPIFKNDDEPEKIIVHCLC